MNDTAINKLVTESNSVNNETVQAAVARMEVLKKEKKVAAMCLALNAISDITKAAVKNLRNAREMEKNCKAELVKAATAEEVFKRTGDVEAYARAVYGTSSSVRYFVQNFQDLVNG